MRIKFLIHLQSPENARGQLDRLEEQILSLDTMPERYRKYEKEPWKSRGLRVLPVDNYVVLYIPDSDKKVVTILRVMYAGRDKPIAAGLELMAERSAPNALMAHTSAPC